MLGMARPTTSWMSSPQFTGRTPERAPNRVLAMVREIRLGFSGYRMGMRNSKTLLSRGFRQLAGWRPSLGWTTPLRTFRHTGHLSGLLTFSYSSRESIDPRPGIRIPTLRISPLCVEPLVVFLKLKLSQHIRILNIPRLGE